MSSVRESGAASHSHGHHGASQGSAAMAEKLLELKNSDPELFNQAWKKLPPSTQENILAYLKKHGGEAQLSSPRHENFEDKNSHKHKSGNDQLSQPQRLDRKPHDLSHPVPQAILDSHRVAPSGRPLHEWTDGELLAHTLIDASTREGSGSGDGRTDADVASELRILAKQNTVQIVQNELIRRLLQTIAGKS
jgi:hypothetical protein